MSFVGWYILVVFVAAIAGIFSLGLLTTIVADVGILLLSPYIALAVIAWYQELAKINNQAINNAINYASVENTNAENFTNNNIASTVINPETNAQANEITKKCINCGTMNKADAKFCINCGNKLD